MKPSNPDESKGAGIEIRFLVKVKESGAEGSGAVRLSQGVSVSLGSQGSDV